MEIYIGTPNERQKEFLRCEKKYIAFGGARGGGKSWAVRCKAKLLAQRYPGIRMLLVRRTMPEIEANHLETLRLELAALLQALMGLEKAMEPPKPAEKQKKETVRVVLSDEAEELSR